MYLDFFSVNFSLLALDQQKIVTLIYILFWRKGHNICGHVMAAAYMSSNMVIGLLVSLFTN